MFQQLLFMAQRIFFFWYYFVQLRIAAGTGTGNANLLNEMHPIQDHTAAMFFVVVSAVWFGTSNSAREIVTERAIYMRERMVNLQLFNYVMSRKYIILSPRLHLPVLDAPRHRLLLARLRRWSAGVRRRARRDDRAHDERGGPRSPRLDDGRVGGSRDGAHPDRARPEVVLGGLMVPMTTNPMLRPLMMIMPARWGFEGSIAQERWAIRNDPAWLIDLHQPGLSSAPDFIKEGHFQCAVAQIQADTLPGAWGFSMWQFTGYPMAVLYALTFAMLLALFILLKRSPCRAAHPTRERMKVMKTFLVASCFALVACASSNSETASVSSPTSASVVERRRHVLVHHFKATMRPRCASALPRAPRR